MVFNAATDYDTLHDATVMEAARAIRAAQRAVQSAAYGDFAGFYAAANDHFCYANRCEAMEARLDSMRANVDYAGIGAFNGNIFKKAKSAISKTVKKATSAVQSVGKAIQKVVPKPIYNIGKAIGNVAIMPTKLGIMAVTNPKKALKQAPSLIFTQPVTAAMKITANVSKIVPVKAVQRAANKVERSAEQLQTYSAAHPLQTVAAAAAVAAVVATAVIVGPALVGTGAATAGGAGGSIVTGAAASLLAAGKDKIIDTVTDFAKDKVTSTAGGLVASVVGGGGGGGYPEPAPLYTEATQTILDASGTPTPGGAAPKSSMAPALAGAAAGFMVGGPIGALLGGGAGWFITRKA